tara:strand:+ start:1064 stop:1453 length:390 start_codon:yes stop_codon:yes gene_type:complete
MKNSTMEPILPLGFTQEQLDNLQGVPILVLEDRHFVYCNDAAVELLGYNTRSDLIESHPFMLSPQYQPDGQPSATKANYMIDIARISGYHCFDWQHKSKNGNLIDLQVSIHHSKWHDGKKCFLVQWTLL